MQDSPLIVGSRTFQSRLLVGTGKYKDLNETDFKPVALKLSPLQSVV